MGREERRDDLGHDVLSRSGGDQLPSPVLRSPRLRVHERLIPNRQGGRDRPGVRIRQLRVLDVHEDIEPPPPAVELDAQRLTRPRIGQRAVLLVLEDPLWPSARLPALSRWDPDLHDLPVAVDEGYGHPFRGRVDAIRRHDKAPSKGEPVLTLILILVLILVLIPTP